MTVNIKSEEKSARQPYKKPELTEIVLEDYTEGKKTNLTETTFVGAS